jgi:hypothetical protein
MLANESNPVMTQEEWLARYIDSAFEGVTLGDGIDIYAAQSLDSYGDPDEDRLSLTAERTDWRRVPHEDLFPRFWALTFLDSAGFRFYTPATMTALLQPHDSGECLSSWFLCNLHVTKDGLIKGVHFSTLFSQRQRAALIRFLKYLNYNCGRPGSDGEAFRRLHEIQTRT